MAESSPNTGVVKDQSEEPTPLNPPSHYPERAAWFDATRPPAYRAGAKFSYFWRGIGVRNVDEVVDLAQYIHDQCEEKGLFKVDDLADPATVEALDLMVKDLLKRLPGLINSWPQEPTPKTWLEDWVMTFIYEIWGNWRNRDQNSSPGVALLPPGTYIQDCAGFDRVMSSIKAPSPVDRGVVVFKLLVMSEDRQTELATEELPAYKALPADSNNQLDTHYQLDNFRREFENHLNSTVFRDKKINLRHGQFGYEFRKRFKEIKRQPDFENAVSYLFKGLKKDGTIEFVFYMENASEKKNRENRQKAQARIKEQRAAKQVQVTQPSAAAEAVPSSGMLTSHEKTLQALENPRTPDSRPSGESHRIASPSNGMHRRKSESSNPHHNSRVSLPLSTRAGQSSVVEQVVTIDQPPSSFSVSPTSPTSPKKLSIGKRIGNLLKKAQGKGKAKEVDPVLAQLALPSTMVEAQPASATSSIKRGSNNRPPRPTSQTQASASAAPSTAPPKSAVPARLSAANKKRNRISGIIMRTFSPVPESPLPSSAKAAVVEKPTEESKAEERDEKIALLGKEVERETYVKGRSEENKVVDDILAAYTGEDESANDEKILDEVEGEDDDDDVAKDNTPEYLANQ
jgi:hypothetical protein